MYATLRGNVEVVEELAKAGADVSIRSQVGPAPAKATSMLKGGGGGVLYFCWLTEIVILYLTDKKLFFKYHFVFILKNKLTI